MKVEIVKVLVEGKVEEYSKKVYKQKGIVGIILEEYTVEISDKSEIDILKKKYESGNYICIRVLNPYKISKGYYLVQTPQEILFGYAHKLIHKKHESVLKAYLENPKVEIEKGKFFSMTGEETPSKWVRLKKDFLKNYNEEFWYRLKVEEIKEEVVYLIFKRNDLGEVFRFDSEVECTIMFSYTWRNIGLKIKVTEQEHLKQIPYDSKRQLYDGQPVLCWDDGDKRVELRFYDLNHSCAFYCKGGRDGAEFDNIQALSPEQLKLFPELWGMYKGLDIDFEEGGNK